MKQVVVFWLLLSLGATVLEGGNVRKREAVPADQTWNVEAFYESPDAWLVEFGQATESAQSPRWTKLASYRGTLQEGPEQVKQALEAYFAAARVVERLYVYAHLRHDENLTEESHRQNYSRIAEQAQVFSQEAAWMEPELLDLSEQTLEGYLSSAELQDYKLYLERVVRKKQHTLSAREEELIAMAGQALNTPSKTFSVLENADFRFEAAEDGQGKLHPLTLGNYVSMQGNSDRKLRESSFRSLHSQFGNYENTLCELLNGQVQTHRFYAQSHHFPTCLEAALFPFNIAPQVYRNLLDVTHRRLPSLHRYMQLRKQIMEVDELHLWDVYVPLVEGESAKVPYSQAVEWVIASVAPLGEEYQEVVRRGLTQDRWVDPFENENKRSGGYSSGCYDSFPYVLMNYTEELEDVFTLAHEVGHSMHSYLCHQSQPFHYSSYPIFVAEVASTFNEELLQRYLMEHADTDQRRLYLINHKLESIRRTFFRQAMFAEFELQVHEWAEQGMPLTPSLLKQAYRDLYETYFGPDVVVDDEIAIEWARIPHFYYNFYVYQYATGISAAQALADRVMSGGEEERIAYLGFLQGGSSRDALDLLKGAGVDMTQPHAIEALTDSFQELIDQLESLLLPTR